ncbi:MAG: hypothetical protein LBT47_01040 [Deltaproteobacteria bacterium]|jgi:hypothetical protein|nr:hypothetical protein [Deltaproteobacteria bacterium]
MEVTLEIKAENLAEQPLKRLGDGLTQVHDKASKAKTATKLQGDELKKVDDKAKSVAKSFAGLTTAVKKMTAQTGDLAKKFNDVGKSMKEVAGKAAELGAKVLASTAALTYGFKSFFVDIAAEAEDCGRLLSANLGSEMGVEALKGIREFSETTGQELRGATEAFLAMNRGGIRPTADSLRAVADMAAAHGKSMADVATSFENTLRGQAGGLEEFGVKSEQIGERLLFTYTNQQGELIRLASNAGDPENLNKILAKISQDKAGGAEEERGKSFVGMVSKIKTAWAEFRTLIMDNGPFAFVKEQLESILAWVARLRESGSLRELAKEWGEKLTNALKKVKDGVKAAYDQFKRWLPTISSVYEKIGGFKTVLAAVGVFLAGPLVSALVKAASSLGIFSKAMLTTPVGWIAIAGTGLVALLNHFGILEPLIEGLKAGFSAMSDVLGGAFKAVLESLCGLFGDMGLVLTDVNGQVNPEAWRGLGEAIAVFTTGALADLISGLAKALGFLHDLGAGLGAIAGSVVYGDQAAIEQRNNEDTLRERQIYKAKNAGNWEEVRRLSQEGTTVANQRRYQDVGKNATIVPGRVPMAGSTQGLFALQQEKGIPQSQAAQKPFGYPQQATGRVPMASSTQSLLGLQQKKTPSPGQVISQAVKPQEVKTSVDVIIKGSLPEGFSATASSTSPNTNVSDKTKLLMGRRPH